MSTSIPLLLGTAQLTSRYGVTNGRDGDPSIAESLGLLGAARALGIRALDTAPAYGGAEVAIGTSTERFVVHTKVQKGLLPSVSLGNSRARLGASTVDVLYLHDPDEILRPDGPVLADARALVTAGELRLGASIYGWEQFEAAIADPDVSVVQVPVNLLDRRFAADALSRAATTGTEVVVRSVLLQGVLAADPDDLASTVAHLAPHVRRLETIARAHDLTLLELAIGWVANLAPVSGVVLGATEPAELRALAAAAGTVLDPAVLEALDGLPLPEPSACDPRRWASP